MKKVFIIHGFGGSPNGGWRPWLMGELEKLDIYACALAMPTPESPHQNEWIEEISRYINSEDQIYLVGHSLGVPAIFRCLENAPNDVHIAGAVLVSGPAKKNDNPKIDSFFEAPFDFEKIKEKCSKCVIMQGDNDPNVPQEDAQLLSQKLGKLILVPNGGHLNGSSGWFSLPQVLEALKEMF